MVTKDEEPERREVSEAEVQFIVAQACDLIKRNRRDGFAAFHVERIEEGGRIMFRFIVSANSTGTMFCVYDPTPLVADYLGKTEDGDAEGQREARFGLLAMLQSLAQAISIGLINAYDVSQVERLSSFAASDSVKKKNARRFPRKKFAEMQRDTLKRMDARNRMLLEEPRRGPVPKVTEERLAAAVGWLRKELPEGEQLTVEHLDNRLRCRPGTVYKFLQRRALTLDEFLARCS
jgi:hypothetical protein